MLNLVVPDFVSPSYFPAIAAHQLGYFADEGVDVDLTLRFPVTEAAEALRDGTGVDFIAGAAHAPMYAFPDWRDAQILMALSRNMYWFLVVRSDLDIRRGDLAAIKGLRIGAAPGPDDGLRSLLAEASIEPADVDICAIPGSSEHGTSFGLAAAAALEGRLIDGFWANGMGMEVAVRSGTGTVVHDARRDRGYPLSTSCTFPALLTRAGLVRSDPAAVTAMVRAIIRSQHALAGDAEVAAAVGHAVFPAHEASLIASLIERDAEFYEPSITSEMVDGITRLARESGRSTPTDRASLVWTGLADLLA